MNKTKSGFTIVEVLVVCVILVIMAGVGAVVYTTIRGDASANQAKGMLTVARAGLERYYTKNGEYPDAATLSSNASDVFNMTNVQYNQAAAMLNTTAAALKNSDFKFVPCSAGAMCTNIRNDNSSNGYVLYITRDIGADSLHLVSVGSCTVELAGATSTDTSGNSVDATGPSSYILVYRAQGESGQKMYVVRSAQGTAEILGSGCAFDNI